MTIPDNKNQRRRRLLLKNTSIATIGCSLPILALFVVKALDIPSYSYTILMIIIFWVALTRQLVELHGGAIGVESPAEGRGSTFYFTIPVTAVDLTS